jgi:hypothetical protein
MAEELAGLGLPYQSIAASIGVHVDTLHKYYRAHMEIGKAKMHQKMVGALVTNAIENMNVQAQALYIKTQMGWSETNKVEHSGAMQVLAPWVMDRRVVEVIDVEDTTQDTSGHLDQQALDVQTDSISAQVHVRPEIVRRNPAKVIASRANGKKGGLAKAANKKAQDAPGASDRQAGGMSIDIHPPVKNSKNEVV